MVLQLRSGHSTIRPDHDEKWNPELESSILTDDATPNPTPAGSTQTVEPPLQMPLLIMAITRKNIRLPAENYVGRRRYFITICCDRRRRFLAQSSLAVRIVQILRATAFHQKMAVYTYCLMPDHLHALVIGLEPTSDLRTFVMDFKRKATAEFQSSNSSSLWQKKFYDYILRSNDSNDRVAAYIWMNPVRKGLCTKPQDYPFSGSFVSDWKPSPDLSNPWIPSWKQNISDPIAKKVL